MPLDELSSRPNHAVGGQINTNAWEKAGMARRINQARLKLRQLRISEGLESPAALEAADAVHEMEVNFQAQVQAQHDAAALHEDMSATLVDHPHATGDDFLERLNDLGSFKPGSAEFTKRYMRGSQAPEVVQYVYTPGAGEGGMGQKRLWAVDSDPLGFDFGKRAGDEMTDLEYSIVCANRTPVNWDKDGNPTEWAPLHDKREFVSGDSVELVEATPEERQASKQYHVTGYVSEGVGGTNVPATEHVILPDEVPPE